MERAQVILLVEDDPVERLRLAHALQSHTDVLLEAATVADAISHCATHLIDLVILDLGLPDGHGIEILHRLRTVSQAPVLVHSGSASETEKVALLDAGADDFVTKPVGCAELSARVQSHLRRSAGARRAVSELPRIAEDGLEIDCDRRRVVRDGVERPLTPTEWALLRALLMHLGSTVAHRQLWEYVWGREFGDAALHLRVHITHLRRKIERHPTLPRFIITEPGVGYRFDIR